MLATSDARTDGITDVSFIRDLTGDGRPEILFGLPHVHGAFDSMDFDPGDDDISRSDTTVGVQVVIRQGETSAAEDTGTADVSFGYTGVDDLVIRSATPTTPSGSNPELSWQNTGDSEGEWALIKFKDVLSILPDVPENIDIGGIRAVLSFRVFSTGGSAVVHQCVTDFNELTTFNTFSVSGGAPVGGIDYLFTEGTGGLAGVDGDSVDFVEADVSQVVRSLLDGELTSVDNELRFILVPNQDETDSRTSVRSSEFPTIESDRPRLTIDYTRINFAGARACYPDNLVNNQTDQPDDFDDDTNFYAGGMALIFNSQNRDNAGAINTNRLENVGGVALEMVGQRGLILGQFGLERSGGSIFARVDNSSADDRGNESDQAGRISGARFVAGPFDYVDASQLRQGAREGLFGQSVASLGDLNNDGIDEILISSPLNERYLRDMQTNFGFTGTHNASTRFRGSIEVLPGANYNQCDSRDKTDGAAGTSITPYLDQHERGPFGRCTNPTLPRHQATPADAFAVFAEHVDDFLGGARSAGDFNQDGLDDILCGAPLNDRSSSLADTGAVYVLYGRNLSGNFDLSKADEPFSRPRMLRIRGETPGDKIGWEQTAGLDVNGDRVGDIFISSPTTDFPHASDGGPKKASCGSDLNRDGVVNSNDFDAFAFNSCVTSGNEILRDSSSCKAFDYNDDGRVDDDDETVFRCLSTTGGSLSCCDNVVDNGFVGIVFGGVTVNGDRTISQIGTKDLPGVVFYGAAAGDRAGLDVSSAGDFNRDGFGDILISAPGEARVDRTGEGVRQGVVYLIFGGTHLFNTRWSLAQVGSEELPGIVFLSPYPQGSVDEAAPRIVGLIGDVNNDGFGDIAIGNPRADYLDENFPQGSGGIGDTGRLEDAGEIYIIYGNNFGSNRPGS
ncbi:MAG: FG-GAP repeat protein [Planctomycetes bacterium]|nr:FG-GAP repeat protein [Planctomycetota bacterium]